MKLGDRTNFRLQTAATAIPVLLAMAIVSVGSILPIYSDEIGWRLQERFWTDGFDRAVWVTCGPSSTTVPPLFMWPVRMFSALTNLSWPTPIAIRTAGVLVLLAWLLVGSAIIDAACRDDRALRVPLKMMAVGLLSLGVLPYMLVMSRIEGVLRLAIAIGILAVLKRRDDDPSTKILIRLAVIVCLSAIVIAYHPKGVFFAPWSILAAWLTSRRLGTRAVRTVAICLIALSAWLGFQYWNGRLSCPADPLLAAKLATQNLAAAVAERGGILMNLPLVWRTASMPAYIWPMLPSTTHMSGWLPSAGGQRALLFAWALMAYLAWIAAISATGVALVAIALFGKRFAARTDPRFLIAASLQVLLLGWSALQLTKNAYESGFVLPTLVVSLILVLSVVRMRYKQRIVATAGTLLVLLGSMSLAMTQISYAPKLNATRAISGYPPGQQYSISLFHYRETRDAVIRLAARCGITPDRSEQVLVDELTFFSFERSRSPFFRTGFLSDWEGSLGDPAAYLLSTKSDGVVARCSELPPAMRLNALREGQLCCLSRELLSISTASAAQSRIEKFPEGHGGIQWGAWRTDLPVSAKRKMYGRISR